MKKCGICGREADQVLMYSREMLCSERLKHLLAMCNIDHICIDCRTTLTNARITEKIKKMTSELKKEIERG